MRVNGSGNEEGLDEFPGPRWEEEVEVNDVIGVGSHGGVAKEEKEMEEEV